MNPHMLTVSAKEAASMMGVHYETMLDMISAGKLPAAKIGRAFILLTSDVAAYIERQIALQTAERMGLRSISPKRRRKVAAAKIGISG